MDDMNFVSSKHLKLTESLDGYAFTNLPTSPGTHRLEFMAWRPVGSLYDRLLGNIHRVSITLTR